MSRNILHESLVANKTVDGTVYEKDLMDVFALMIIALDLSSAPPPKFSFLKHNPYLFHLETALAVMRDLKFSFDLFPTTTTIAYRIELEQAEGLVNRFYAAKLLHSPADRTRNRPKSGVYLQPTPKGVAIVRDFCKRVGLYHGKCPPIVMDRSFNTMELLYFERDVLSDKIMYSDFFLCILLIRLMGPKPNVWSPKMKPDPLPEAKFGAEVALADFLETAASPAVQKNIQSPFYHRFFTNPESDAHIQYYVSTPGVRLFRDKSFSGQVVPFCTSGAAITQWLCDCTDIMATGQVIQMATLLLRRGYIEAIEIPPLVSRHDQFINSKDAFYILGSFGTGVVSWDVYSKPTRFASSRRKAFTLEDILRDPGMRYLFRKHLETEYCVENLDLFVQLKLFERRIKYLTRLIESKGNYEEDTERVKRLLAKLGGMCMLLAYYIYFTYLCDESPFVVNIDYKLRDTVQRLMLNIPVPDNSFPSTPLESSFQKRSVPGGPITLESIFCSISGQNREKLRTGNIRPSMAPEKDAYVMENGVQVNMSRNALPHTKITDCQNDLWTNCLNAQGHAGCSSEIWSSGSDDARSSNSVNSSSRNNVGTNSSSVDENLSKGEQITADEPPDNERMFSLLSQISKIFDKVNIDVCRMMERDLLPKFMASDLFQEIIRKIDMRV